MAPKRSARPKTAVRRKTLASLVPTAARLQKLIRVKPAAGRREVPQAVSMQSGVVKRSGLLRNAADGRSGFAWNVPAPERGRRLLWASISFDWQFWGWHSFNAVNNSGSKVWVDGSLDWDWLLTGHPMLFPNAPVLMGDNGHFSFNTFVVPGADGWSAGWIVPAKSNTFVSTGNPSTLAELLSLKKDGVLKLWYSGDCTNVQLHTSRPLGTGAYGVGGGPNTLYYLYAYGGPTVEVIDWEDMVLSQ